MRAMHDYCPPSLFTVKFTRVFFFSSTATHSVFALGVQPVCKMRTVAELVEDAAPHSCRHHPSASVPLCCLLPVSLTAVSRAPANGGTPINCVHVAATANVYILKLLIPLRHWGFNLMGRHAPRSAPIYRFVRQNKLSTSGANLACPRTVIKVI